VPLQIQRKLQIVFASLAVPLVCMFVLLGQLRLRQSDSRQWVMHTENVLAELASLLANIMGADSAAKSYVITGQQPYLGLYEAAVRETGQTLESLDRLLADNAGQHRRLVRLRLEIQESKRLDSAAVEVVHRLGLTVATRAVAQRESLRAMESARAMAGQMGDEERRLLAEREAWMQASGRAMTFALVVTGALVLVLLCAAYFLFNRDARHRESLERELNHKNAELEGVSRHKSEFLAHMSHELRTPLNAVIGYVGTLLMRLPGPLTADQEKQLKTVQSNARHLLSLINELLDVAKIESGKVDVQLESLLCREVIEQVIASLGPLAQAKSINLEGEFPDRPIEAKTDRRAFSQILINLTNNAIKFTDKGSVRLELGERNVAGAAMAVVNIIDTGLGVRAEDQPHLFHAFEQLRDGKSQREGTGLGLHVSRKLAALIGARIEFASEYGRGSCFTVLLPKV
jgi:signal transduction histidine kinase